MSFVSVLDELPTTRQARTSDKLETAPVATSDGSASVVPVLDQLPTVQQVSATGEPVIAPAATPLGRMLVASESVTVDGTCGVGNGGTICGNWPQGSCCSMYG